MGILVGVLIGLLATFIVDYEAYLQKLTIEKGRKPLASSFVRLFVDPKMRPDWIWLSRVTVYDDIIVAKLRPLYNLGFLNHRSDVVNYDTGISTNKSIFKFLADWDYRLGHIITRDSILSFTDHADVHEIKIKYGDAEGLIHTLTIKKPYLLTSSYKNLLLNINGFVSTKDPVKIAS